jgi:hypothetical protein
MKTGKRRCSLIAAGICGGVFAITHAWADSMDCSGTKKSKDRPYTEDIRPGDLPDHVMRQAIRTHVISSKDADLDGSEQTVFAHEGYYAKAGTSVGYFLYTLKSGDKIWARFDSVASTVSMQGSWEATYQGAFRFIAGTGKFSGIRGRGSL